MQQAALLSFAASVLVLTACASSAPPLAVGDPPPDPALAPALDRAAAGDWDYLRIDAGCRAEPRGWHSTTLFGSGVGIVDERRQFAVPRHRLLALLARFREIGFASMPAILGGTRPREAGDPPTEAIQDGEEGAEAPLQAICVLSLRIDDLGRSVQQLDRGERSAALLALAEEVLAVGETAGAGGVTAADLDDALAKLASGELAAEALRLTVDRRDAEGNGWLLIVDGGFSWVRPIEAASGLGSERRFPVDAETVGELATALRDHDFGGLRGNLYDPGYLLVRVDLLGHEHEVLAQPFAGMNASTHGAEQVRLGGVVASARDLARELLAAP